MCCSAEARTGWNSLELEFQEVRNLLMWELGIELWHSGSQQTELLSQVLRNLQERIFCFY